MTREQLREIIPPDWARELGVGPIGLGHDIATTTKGTSNWSSLTVLQNDSPLYIFRLFMRWRTADPEVNLTIIDLILEDIESRNKRPRRLCVDASNERYHAQRTRRMFAGRVPVELIVAGEKVDWRGETFDYKTLEGNLYTQAFEDNLIALPPGKWLRDDHRLVIKESGRFVAQLGTDGGHGDTFDGGKHALWALESGGGPVRAEAAAVGNDLTGKADRPGLRNPLAHLFNRNRSRLNA